MNYLELTHAGHFFEVARERYRIKIKKECGQPWPWTDDSVFQQYSFCNVHREDDKTTSWFRENVRDLVSGKQAVEATVIFRWFNRIETGDEIVDLLLDGWNTEEARRRLRDVRPLVTGAYIIKTVTGMNKLDGALYSIDKALPLIAEMWEEGTTKWSTPWDTLQDAHQAMMHLDHIGAFMAYEIVSDLRWTDVLGEAEDINYWANAGPGCARGLSRLVYGRLGMFNRHSAQDQETMNELMHRLLVMSREEIHWPQHWKRWEMREVEHWLCEYDKYMRARGGEGLKRRYRP